MTEQEFNFRYTFDGKTDRLGSGGFGTVYRIYDNFLNLYKALKIAEVKNINGKEYSLLTEFENVKKISTHVNIANYESVYQFSTKQGVFDYAIMQYYEDGTLKDLIKKHTLTDAEKISLIKGVLNGLNVLHRNGLIHRDLKPGNILIAKDPQGMYIPKISDFGLSKMVLNNDTDSISNSLQVGAIDYISPEQLMGLKLLFNSDLWSVGVIMFELFTGKKPFGSDENSDAPDIRRINFMKQVFTGRISDHIIKCPLPYRQIIERCLEIDPYKRVKSVNEVIQYINKPELLTIHQNNRIWDDDDETTALPLFEDNGQDISFQDSLKRILVSLGIATIKKAEPADTDEKDEIRLKKVENILRQQEEQLKERKERFKALKEDADLLYKNGALDDALIKYKSANAIIDNDVEVVYKIEEISEKLRNYKSLVREADRLLDDEKFNEAIVKLENAQTIYPFNKYPAEQLLSIKQLTSVRNEHHEYQNIVAKADELCLQRKFKEALPLYERAYTLKKDHQIFLKIQNVEKIIESLSIQEKYKIEIEQGDKYFLAGNYEKATDHYNNALQISPTESYPKDKIIAANDRIATLEKQRRFDTLIQKADLAFDKKEYETALLHYQQVINFMRDNERVANKIALTQQLLSEQNQINVKTRFDQFVNEGDIAIDKNKYKYAISMYEAALNLIPHHPGVAKKLEIAIQLNNDQRKRIWINTIPGLFTSHIKKIYTVTGIFILLFSVIFFANRLPKGSDDAEWSIIYKNGRYGCRFGEVIISPQFDTVYMDRPDRWIGIRNDSLFRIFNDGKIEFVKPEHPIKPAPRELTENLLNETNLLKELYELLRMFPDHSLTRKIQLKIDRIEKAKLEEDLYKEIKQNPRNIDLLKRYKDLFSSGLYIKEIEKLINQWYIDTENLNENTLFELALKENSVELFKKYLKEYPFGKYAKEVKTRIQTIENENDHKAWKEASENAWKYRTTVPIDNYLKKYSLHKNEAEDLKKQITERIKEENHERDWKEIKDSGECNRISKFILDNPKSKFKEEAEKLINMPPCLSPPEKPEFIRDIEKKFIEIPSGTFKLGCNTGDKCDDDATPEVNVSIRSVFISKYEVTQQEYKSIMGTNPSFYSKCSNCPVENVSYHDAIAYIDKLNSMDGNPYKFRLPTEAEWEYFALGGQNFRYAGSDNINEVARYGTKIGGTVRVGSKKSNGMRLHDMTGNVAEWCTDYYYPDAYTRYGGKEAKDPNNDKSRVVRGGSFKDPAHLAYIKKRRYMPQNEKEDWVGFRLVMELK